MLLRLVALRRILLPSSFGSWIDRIVALGVFSSQELEGPRADLVARYRHLREHVLLCRYLLCSLFTSRTASSTLRLCSSSSLSADGLHLPGSILELAHARCSALGLGHIASEWSMRLLFGEANLCAIKSCSSHWPMLVEHLLLRRILLLGQYLLHQSLLLRAHARSLQVLHQVDSCILPGRSQHLVLRHGCSLHSGLLLDLLWTLEVLPVRSMLVLQSIWAPGRALLASMKEASVGVLSVGVDCEVGRLSRLLRVRC